MSDTKRDHLFISYAGEDGAFAEWLTLRLAAENYRVWCDRIKLLGGESYPRDIDIAIKEQTYRFLAILSRNSIKKPNPLKERTLALNLARNRNEEFIIPINLDGIEPTELDWMMSDITFVPFYRGWAEGLAKLLKVLESIGAPRTLQNGRDAVSKWVGSYNSIKEAPERLWSNALEVTELPAAVLRVEAKRGTALPSLSGWPHYRENDRVAWVFEFPEKGFKRSDVRVESVDWNARFAGSGIVPRNVVVNLLRQYLHAYCLAKGMREREDSKRRKHLYFPREIVPKTWLPFDVYDGTRSRVRAVGTRRFWTRDGNRELTRYYLSPTFSPQFGIFSSPVVVISLRVNLTDANDAELPLRKSVARRKAICKSWWNYEWLSRLQAVVQWLAAGQQEIDLAFTNQCRIAISGTAHQVSAPVGIDEESLKPFQAPEAKEKGTEGVE